MKETEYILDKLSASAFDLEIAAKRNNLSVVDDAGQRQMSATIRGFEAGIPRVEISRAETEGKLKAAIEEGDNLLEEFYSRVLRDIE